ncbi:MAG: 50S ribosomal protein L4 [Candidatus Yonathbacteria bacterium]|nr:50S ribosomal protein L4 [Candidatus Yonathbacteria bacterium]
MNTVVYNAQGKEAGKTDLPDAVFGLPWNADLVHQVVISMEANARTPIAHTKSRADVSGTGKKPWKQKGTGRARHGSRRSPIWVGGGVAHGPRNDKDYSQKVNKKMAKKALHTVLSAKLRDNELLFVDALSIEAPKTTWAKDVIKALGGVKGFEGVSTRRKNAVLIATGSKSDAVYKSFGNFGNIAIQEARNLNPMDVLRYKYIIVTEPNMSVPAIAREKTTA